MSIVSNFDILKNKYDEFDKSLISQGKYLGKETEVGFWGVTPLKEAYDFFREFGLHRHQNFLDLGSGDGRIVLLASLFDIQAHGLEMDEEIIDAGINHRDQLRLPQFANTKFLQKDFLEHGIEGYDVIFISPDKPFFRSGLDRKLFSEMNGKLIVHGWEFHPPGLTLVDEKIINGEKFSVYEK